AKVGVIRTVELADSSATPSTIIRYTIPKRFVLHEDASVSIQSTVTGVSVLNFTDLGHGAVLAEGESLQGKPSALAALFDAAPEISAAVHDTRTITLPKINTAVDKTTDTITVYRQTGQSATDFIAFIKTKIDPVIERYNAVTDTAKNALQQI